MPQASPPREIDDVRGWFARADQLVMDHLLRRQADLGVTGDLLEMGAFLGKTSILIGFHRRMGERFVVCDLFGNEPPTESNRRTASWYTENLTREAFEANYLAFHDDRPELLQAPTAEVLKHVAADSCRFVHIDACHLYDFVREDIQTARSVLNRAGIVVFDDIRSVHTPGVAAAVWPEVVQGGLHPICITQNKLYATWGDATAVHDSTVSWLAGQDDARYEVQDIAGHRLIRVDQWVRSQAAPVPRARNAPPALPEKARGAARRVALDLLPPIAARKLRRVRRRPG